MNNNYWYENLPEKKYLINQLEELLKEKVI